MVFKSLGRPSEASLALGKSPTSEGTGKKGGSGIRTALWSPLLEALGFLFSSEGLQGKEYTFRVRGWNQVGQTFLCLT